ncbi:hypothetical protein MKX03_000789 [Papaver bracteatum]|nr:hypothetical protein MKX03_000789 [Papaver bracteatum]
MVVDKGEVSEVKEEKLVKATKKGAAILDRHLLDQYKTNYHASKDDITVHADLHHQSSLTGVSAEGSGVSVEGFTPVTKESVATPSVTDAKPAEDDDDDSDVDLFGEEIEEEKKAAEERAVASLILLDVNPWDDETDMAKLEETVRSVQVEGLSWGMFGYGIKKLKIMMTIVGDLVSIGSIIGFWLSGL